MYPLGLSAAERKLFARALRGDESDPSADPEVPGPPEDDPPDPGTEPPPTPPTPDPGTGNPMRFVTANIGNFMNATRTREDFAAVRDLGTILMFQEIREGAHQQLFHHAFPASDWYTLPTNPHRTDKIAIKKSLWNLEQVGSYFMSPKPPVQGRPRYCNVALVTLRGTRIQFAVVNTHYVAYAWSNHKIADKAIRKRYWTMHYNRQQSLMQDIRSKGITSIGGGDFNRGVSGLDKFVPSQVWLRQASLDHLFGIPAPGGASFTKLDDQSVSLNSDHNALVAKLQWTAGSNPIKHGYNWTGH